MTDRVRGFTVVLDVDYREDDIEPLRNAIALFPGVVSVSGIKADVQSHISDERAMGHWRDKLASVLWPKEKP